MLMPKRTKFRKMMKGRNRGKAHRGNSLAYGSIGLKAVEHGRIDSRQIEASRIAMTRAIKRQGKVWIFKGEVLAKGIPAEQKEEEKPKRRPQKRRGK